MRTMFTQWQQLIFKSWAFITNIFFWWIYGYFEDTLLAQGGKGWYDKFQLYFNWISLIFLKHSSYRLKIFAHIELTGIFSTIMTFHFGNQIVGFSFLLDTTMVSFIMFFYTWYPIDNVFEKKVLQTLCCKLFLESKRVMKFLVMDPLSFSNEVFPIILFILLRIDIYYLK